MANIETMIQWMKAREGKVSYDMNNRLGPTSYDCSSAVYFALRAGGFLSATKMGNTDSLFNDLESSHWQKVPVKNGAYAVKRGDIFIWGTRGSSGGANGHTGIFIDEADTIIHCNYGYNGVSINNHDVIWKYNGQPPVTVYRYAGQTVKKENTKINIGALDYLDIENGKVRAKGWHYAIGAKEFIFAMDAATGKEITRVTAPATKRLDVQKAYPHLVGADQCGFSVLLNVPENQSIKIKARTTDSMDGNSQYIDLDFDKIFKVPFAVGKKVTLLNSAKNYQTGEIIPKSVKNKQYTIQQIKEVHQSKSKKAYLLKEILSWVLEQDVG